MPKSDVGDLLKKELSEKRKKSNEKPASGSGSKDARRSKKSPSYEKELELPQWARERIAQASGNEAARLEDARRAAQVAHAKVEAEAAAVAEALAAKVEVKVRLGEGKSPKLEEALDRNVLEHVKELEQALQEEQRKEQASREIEEEIEEAC